MEYFIIQNPDLQKFIEAVNKSIQKGWTPIGGVAVIVLNTAIGYAQAMIRPKEQTDG